MVVCFLVRNKELSSAQHQLWKCYRCQHALRRDYAGGTSNFEQFLLTHDLDGRPDCIWNCDESGFLLSPKSGKVLAPHGTRSVYRVCSAKDKTLLHPQFYLMSKSVHNEIPTAWPVHVLSSRGRRGRDISRPRTSQSIKRKPPSNRRKVESADSTCTSSSANNFKPESTEPPSQLRVTSGVTKSTFRGARG